MNAMLFSTTATLALLALSILILLKETRRGRVPLAFGLLLLALIEIFSGLATRGGDHVFEFKRLVLVCTALIPAAFLLYGMMLTRASGDGSRVFAAAPLLVFAALFSAAALLLPLDQLYAGLDPATGRLLLLGGVGYWFRLGLVIFCIAALVNLESVFTGVRGTDRWRVKYEFLGVGAILAGMIYFLSQGLFFTAQDVRLQPARSGVVIVAALLIGYSRLYRGKTANLAVSRQALYRSFTLAAAGIYLLVLVQLGRGTRRFNVSITQNLSLFIAVLSGMAFLALLLSEDIRRRLKIFLAKHFYAHKHDYREEWLGFSSALAACHGLAEVRAAIVDRYQGTFGLRFAALYERDRAQDSFTLAAAQGRTGLPARVGLTAGFLGYFVQTGRVMNPADEEYTPTAEESAFIRDVEAWLLVPLLVGDHVDAFVLCGGQMVPERLTYEDFDLMKVIGRQAALSLTNLRLADELTEAREMAAVAKVTSFVIHDLKNLAYTFSLMMENAGEHIAQPEFQRDLVKSIQGTVAKMNALIAKLRSFPEKMELKLGLVDLAGQTREVLDEVQGLKEAVSFESDLAPAEASVDPQEFRKVVLNLLLNACDAVGAQGIVRVKTGRRRGEVVVSVEDNGRGMPEAFVQGHLFRPFRTTKEKGLGIGLYQSRQIVEAHGGRIEVVSREGEGTMFTVVLPGGGQAPE